MISCCGKIKNNIDDDRRRKRRIKMIKWFRKILIKDWISELSPIKITWERINNVLKENKLS